MSKYAVLGIFLQCLFYSFLFAGPGKAQRISIEDVQVLIEFKNSSVEEAIEIIEGMTEFKFSYKRKLISKTQRLNLDKTNLSLADLLRNMAKTTRLSFTRIDETIHVTKEKQQHGDPFQGVLREEISFDRVITGKVTDESGEGLPGVNVLVKNSPVGTITDVNGDYKLNVPDDARILVFSYVGYLTEEIEITGESVLDLSLSPDIATLSEIVVVGYGTARRKDLTGSVVSKDLENSAESNLPSTNILQSMRGISGVNLGPQNTPGSTPEILIRGQNSINGLNSPLIVLDGIIFLGSVADINPQDIATIDVLKDASAAAVYGSRSANGVIVITTKKGKIGKPVISYNTSVGINTWQNKFDMMGLETYKEKFTAQQGFASVDDIIFDDETRNEFLAQNIDTDWMDLISRSGSFQDHLISVSGATDKTSYYFSGGYNRSKGVIVGSEFERVSGRMRLETDITDWLQIGIDGTYNRSDNSGIVADIRLASNLPPIGFPYRYEGMPFNASSANSNLLEKWPTGSSIRNPLWETDRNNVDDFNVKNYFRFAGFANINIPQIEGLSYRVNFTTFGAFTNQDRFFFEDNFIPFAATNLQFERYAPSAVQNLLSQANGYNRDIYRYNYVVDNIINYRKEIGEHYFDATLVATRDFTYRKETQITGSDYSEAGNTSLGIDGIHKAAVQISNLDIDERANIGYLGRVSYAFKDRYHLTGTIRRDGASVFGEDRKWGTFPSIGLAWTASEEDFAKSIDFLDYLKLRVSYGKNGNQALESPYNTLSRVNSGPDGGIRYEFGDAPSEVLYGIAQANLANPNLGWETTTSFNGGIQSALLNNRVFFDLDFYFSKTTDQIFSRLIPIMTGFTSILSSLGRVDNRGIEINLRTVNLKKGDFTWESNLAFWQNRNTVKSLYDEDLDENGVEDDDIANSLFIGESLGAIYNFEFIGVVQEDDAEYMANTGAVPGDPMLNDLNGDGFIDADNDRKILGFRKPNFSMNFGNTLTYKNFSLYVLLTGIFGGGKDNFYIHNNPLSNAFGNRFDTNEVNHPWWTPENRSNEFLRPNYTGNQNLGLQSRGFVKIQDISLSYRLPKSILNNIGFSSLSAFVSARNVHVFTDWFGGGDPEYQKDGITGIRPFDSVLPVPTTLTFGINTSF